MYKVWQVKLIFWTDDRMFSGVFIHLLQKWSALTPFFKPSNRASPNLQFSWNLTEKSPFAFCILSKWEIYSPRSTHPKFGSCIDGPMWTVLKKKTRPGVRSRLPATQQVQSLQTGFTRNVFLSNGIAVKSGISPLLQHTMTGSLINFQFPSVSQHCAFGYEVVSLRPSLTLSQH